MAKSLFIENAINNVANNRLAGKYNLSQYREGAKLYNERLNAIRHKDVCNQIVSFRQLHKDIPLYFALSVGVSKGAYKKSEFDKGYKSFNSKKVEDIAKFGAAYNVYNNIKSTKLSDVTIRLMMRYYEKVSTDYNKFLVDLNNSKVLGKASIKRGNYVALCKNLSIPIKAME